MAAYLLPCSCGRKVPVEPRQAGESIQCPCGASLAVPSMLKMADLEPAEPQADAQAKQNRWGVDEGLALVGTVILLLGGAGAIWMFWNDPKPPQRNRDPVAIQRELDALSPMHSWHLYHNLRRQGPEWDRSPQEEQYAKEIFQRRMYEGALVLVACVGIGLIVAAVMRLKQVRA